jgi:hypothetical protein
MICKRWSSPRRTVLVLSVVMLAALLRIAHTYSVFNHTFDESAHIGAAMQYVDRSEYTTYEYQHPPMRAVYAIGPRLLGIHSAHSPNMWEEGNYVLYADGRYFCNLTAARVAALPFFVLTAILVFLWSRELEGPWAASLASARLHDATARFGARWLGDY